MENHFPVFLSKIMGLWGGLRQKQNQKQNQN